MATNAVQPEVVIAVFADLLAARQCIEDLRLAGFSEDEIGVVAPDDLELDREEVAEHSMVAEGSVVGAFAGAGLGSLWGVAMVAGLLPVIGPIVAGGLLASVIVTAATGAALGSLAGALVGLGVPEEEAARYEQKLHEGHVVVTVKSPSRSSEAMAILNRHHASVETA
ncbi:MAG: hypothetical protein WD894_25590 [Pirellulales bacterium]